MRGVTHKEPVEIILPCRSRIKKWAFDNAYILAASFIFSIGGWIALFILGVRHYVGN